MSEPIRKNDLFSLIQDTLEILTRTETEFVRISDKYIDTMREFEDYKNMKIDQNVRESIEKQLIRLYQEDVKFRELQQEVDFLRRKRDSISKILDFERERLKALLALKDIISKG